jgi:hypothetical protein
VSVIQVESRAVLADPATLPTPVVGTEFAFTTPASVGTPAAAFAVIAGALPTGLNLDPASGIISGIPGVAGPFSFTISATNDVGTVSATYSGTVTAALAATGTETTTPLGLALMLTVGGVAAILLTRRWKVGRAD